MFSRLTEADVRRAERGGLLPMTAERGLELFDRALSVDAALLVPARWDLSALRGSAGTGEGVPELMRALVAVPSWVRRRTVAAAGPLTADQGLGRRLAGLSAAARERELLELVRGQVAAVLGHDGTGEVQAQQAFRSLGFDSLISVELRNRLAQVTGLRLPATLVSTMPPRPRLPGTLRRPSRRRVRTGFSLPLCPVCVRVTVTVPGWLSRW